MKGGPSCILVGEMAFFDSDLPVLMTMPNPFIVEVTEFGNIILGQNLLHFVKEFSYRSEATPGSSIGSAENR